MTRKLDLREEMSEFFDELSNFELAAGEEIELAAMPYPENELSFTTRCADARHAFRVALRLLGPSCELYVAIASSESKAPTPVDPERLLGSWRMREKTKGENGLDRPVGSLKVLPFREPSLKITNLYPSGDRHVCEASVFFHRSRWRNHKKGR